MPQSLFQIVVGRRVATRDIRGRIIAAIQALGEIEGTEAAAIVAFGGPRAIRRRRLVPVIQPSASQASSVRRALARLRADRIIVDAGRRHRLEICRLRREAELLGGVTLGTLDG